jgi:anti-sigma factor RsiW
MTPHGPDPSHEDDPVERLLRERLPRHPAPAALRAAVTQALLPETPPRRWWSLWLPPAVSALATALIMLLWLAPLLSPSAPDPVQLLARAAVSEHARTILWGESRPDAVPAVLLQVMEESGVALNWVFTGDDVIQLVNARPVYLEGRRGIKLAYKDAEGHTVTYLILPAGNLAIPERGRVQIDRWRPYVRKENGFSLIMWKQGGLLCVLASDLVSDADMGRFKQYFVKVRSSTEPYPAY